MKIITLGNEILRKKSVLVPEINREIQFFIESLFETMYMGKGLGLAAVQVGQLLRIFVVHIPQDEPRVFINPEIVETSIELSKYEEGCLSVPGINAEINRPAAVKIQAWNEKEKPFILSAEGLLATVVQHEVDHLNGRLFIDHLDSKKKERLLKQYKEEEQKVF